MLSMNKCSIHIFKKKNIDKVNWKLLSSNENIFKLNTQYLI